MNKSDFLADKFRDHLFRTGSFIKPTVMAVGLLEARIWQPSTAYALGDYVVSTADSPVGSAVRIFKATPSGTGISDTTQPTWPVVDGGTVTELPGANQIIWTEQTLVMQAGTSLPEVSGANGYVRQDLPPLDTNWTGGATGAADNLFAVQFPVATADYGTDANSRVVGFFLAGSPTFGNYASLYYVGGFALADRKDVNLNDQFQFPVGNIDVVES